MCNVYTVYYAIVREVCQVKNCFPNKSDVNIIIILTNNQ